MVEGCPQHLFGIAVDLGPADPTREEDVCRERAASLTRLDADEAHQEVPQLRVLCAPATDERAELIRLVLALTAQGDHAISAQRIAQRSQKCRPAAPYALARQLCGKPAQKRIGCGQAIQARVGDLGQPQRFQGDLPARGARIFVGQ
jgi:hypothetical protein